MDQDLYLHMEIDGLHVEKDGCLLRRFYTEAIAASSFVGGRALVAEPVDFHVGQGGGRQDDNFHWDLVF